MLHVLSIGVTTPLWEHRAGPLQERKTIQVSHGYLQVEHQWPETETIARATENWFLIRRHTSNIISVVAPEAIPPSEDRSNLVALGGNLGAPMRGVTVETPLWVWFLLLALYPSVAFVRGPVRQRMRLRRERRAGLCRTCDYDLTGNVSGVCPECGTPVVRGDDSQ